MTRALGFWSGIACVAMAVAFLAGTDLSVAALPANVWAGDIRAFADTFSPWPMLVTVVRSVFLAPAFLGLMVAVHSAASAERKPFDSRRAGAAQRLPRPRRAAAGAGRASHPRRRRPHRPH